jgi:hypothetical protein
MSHMNREQFNQLALAVTDDMRQHTFPYVASISREVSETEGAHLASGLYLQLRNQPYLLTNEHVARHISAHSLAHQLAAETPAVRFTNPIQTLSDPYDLGLSRIAPEIWNSRNDRSALPVARLADRHSPVQYEFLFALGYAGDRSLFMPTFGTLFSGGTPYLTQESATPPSWMSPMHFALPYAPDRAISMSPRSKGLPTPPGLSGAPVWNTRFHESIIRGTEWTPNMSQITGVVCRWDKSHIVALKIEHVRAFLLDALRREAAYFQWIERGRPSNDALTDWFWAESQIRELCD